MSRTSLTRSSSTGVSALASALSPAPGFVPARGRFRSFQLETRTCLGDEPFDRRLRADVLSRRRRLRAGQGATITHREEGAALDRGRQVGR